MKKEWRDYEDTNGLIVQKHGDGGDSLNRTVNRYLLDFFKSKSFSYPTLGGISDHINLLGDGQGKFRRSNHAGRWYAEFNRTSRDQLIPLIILLGLTYQGDLKKVLKDHLKRLLLFAYNTRRNHVYKDEAEHKLKSTPDVKWNYSWKLPDFTGPDFWALYIRGFNLKLLWPLLWLFDLETVINSIIIRYSPKRDDVINHAVILEYARVRMDTLPMKLARSITSRKLIQARLDTFFGKEIEPPLNELYAKLK